MTTLLLFVLGTIGMSHIIVDGRIFLGLRNFLERILPEFWAQFFKCYQCCGFWCGVFIGLLTIVSENMDMQVSSPLTWTSGDWFWCIAGVFVCGCAGSFLSAWAAVYLNVLEAKMVIDYKEIEDEA